MSLVRQMEKHGMLGIHGVVKHSLDQAAIKRLLRENDAENWLAKLKEVVKDQPRLNLDIELLFGFLQDLFDACVEGGQSSFLCSDF